MRKLFVLAVLFSFFFEINAQEAKVDKYGQFIDINFEGKVQVDDEFKRDLVRDNLYYEGLGVAGRDLYGGLVGSKEAFGLDATGFFYTHKLENKRWVLVTPLGNIFFSLGVNGVGYAGDTYTHIKGREHLYEWLPEFTTDENHPDYKYRPAFLNGNQPENFSFYVANRIRKDGSFNSFDFYKESVSRLQKWGFTSEGGFSNSQYDKSMSFPKVNVLGLPGDYRIPGSSIIDIYKEGASKALEDNFKSQGIEEHANDPTIIGYFFGNEIDYHQFKNVIPAKSAKDVATKKFLMKFLEEKYQTIGAFNSAWSVSFQFFEEAADSSIALLTEQSVTDMFEFFEIYIDKYYSELISAFRKFDKNHLTLGERYFTSVMQDNSIRNILSKAASKHLDVISYNYYTYDLDIELLNSIYEGFGKPIMLTEFHYGDPTQGQTSSIQMMDNELEKGLAYRNYVEQAAATDFVVGTHWFEYLDQAVTGRWFQGYYGEGFGIGFLNVADRPYKKLMEEIMKTNYAIYDIMLKKTKPFSFDFGPGKSGRNEEREITIFRTNQPVVIDGVLDDHWPESEIIQLDKNEIVSGVTQENSSANIRLAYDDNYLYLFAQITDETPSTNAFTGDGIYNGDGIEIFVGPDNYHEGGSLQVKDRQIIIGASSGYKANYHWFNGVLNQPKTDVVIRKSAAGYTVEAALPFKDLNINDVFKSRKVRFDIGFNNGDERQRNTQYMWNGTEANSRTRDNWGVLIFN